MHSFNSPSFLKAAIRFLSAGKQAITGSSFARAGKDAAVVAGFLGEFAGMVAGMESRFVPLGEDLGNIVRHLQTLANAAGEGFGAIRQEISSGSLGQLDVRAQSALDELKAQLEGVSNRMRPLAEVAQDMTRLRSLGDDMRRIGATLQACGCGFAVESSRSQASRVAFASFVEELRGLAIRISVLSTRMEEDSSSTLLKFTAARARISENVDGLSRLALTMRGAFATVSGEIQNLLGGMHSALDRVERHRAKITELTGGVIYYLQFGDLIRQKCEHVIEAAREIQEAEGESSDTSFATVVHTSVAQLNLIQAEVDEARERLSQGYSALNDELTQLAQCGSALNPNADARSSDAWNSIKQHLQDLDAIQGMKAKLNAEALATAGEAGLASASLQAGLGSVREMSTHLHLLALNAIIRTIHLGEGGRALEELAQHVDGLHRTCETVVPQILHVLGSIAHRVEEFTRQESDTSAFDLDGLEQLERAQCRGQSVMREVLALAGVGAEMLGNAVFRLGTLGALSKEIENHRTALAEIAGRLPKPRNSGNPTAFDNRMLQRYTMQSERDAHQRARGITPVAEPEPAKLAVPDFEPAGSSALAAANTPGADLGDNVELF